MAAARAAGRHAGDRPRTRIDARYPAGVTGRAILRRHFDEWLLTRPLRPARRFECGLMARSALADARETALRASEASRSRRDRSSEFGSTASVTIAADGRASRVARSLGLARHPAAPRRWAFGTYCAALRGTGDLGEMHVRGRRYIGIAPIAEDVCNVCVVTGRIRGGRRPRMS